MNSALDSQQPPSLVTTSAIDPREWQFLLDCLTEAPSVADYRLIQDSQTEHLLSETFKRCAEPTIIDYGCGALRHLFGLMQFYPHLRWTYVGVDREDTSLLHPDAVAACRAAVEMEGRWRLMTINELRASKIVADVAYMVNVAHEMPLLDLAAAFQDVKLHLRRAGTLLFMDMGLLPEGEPRFVPIVESDLASLIPRSETLSYATRRGIPIVFAALSKEDFPSYYGSARRLGAWMETKRDTLAVLGITGEANEPARTALGYGLRGSPIFNYLYLNTVVAHATYRVVEQRLQMRVTEADFARACHAVLAEVLDNYDDVDTVDRLFQRLSPSHEYKALEAALSELGRPAVPAVFLAGSLMLEDRIVPSEFLEWLEDRMDRYPIRSAENMSALILKAYMDYGDEYDPLFD